MVLAGLAGCLSNAPAAVQTAGNASAPAPAGTGGQPAPGAPAAAAATPTNMTNATVPTTLPVALKGTMVGYAGACVFTPVSGMCQSRQASAATPSKTYLTLPFTGRVTGGSLKLTHDASGPSAPEVHVTVRVWDVSTFRSTTVATKSGASPIELVVPPVNVSPVQELDVFVYASAPQSLPMTPAGGVYGEPQDVAFELAGSLSGLALPAPKTRAVDYAFAGTIGAFGETCVFPVACQSVPPGSYGFVGDTPKLGGAAASAKLVVSWTAASPATQELAASIYAEKKTASSSTWIGLVSVRGPSPLTLDAAKLTVPEGYTLGVEVYVPGTYTGPLDVWANPADQPVDVKGTFDVLEG